jgi:predicted transposase/invertase (TIGR01784 family)
MYDNVCKFLAETFPEELASWLLGQRIALTKLSPSEFYLEPIRADSLILLQSSELVLHLEFQTETDPWIPFRMLDYRLRTHRRFPEKTMRQVVIYLKPTNAALAYQTSFELENTHHEFEVIRLWEQPPERFLSSPGLYPFAVLTQPDKAEETLRNVAQQLNTTEELPQRDNLSAATGILAGLILNRNLIRQVLRKEIMKESVIYQDILTEGKQEEALMLLTRQLSHRFGVIEPSIQMRLQGLSLKQLEALSLDLLDFSSVEDLETWLNSN